MTERSTYQVRDIDWLTVFLWVGLVLIGWLAIYAADFEPEQSNIFSWEMNYGKQFIWMCVAAVVAICLMVIDSRFYTTFTYVIYGVILAVLFIVLFVGVKVSGSTSWLQIGALRFQPSEFAKFATTLALAKYLSTLNVTIKTLKSKLVSFVIMLAPTFLIILQGDMGSAIVYFSLILVLYREGMSGEILVAGVLLIVLFILALLVNNFVLVSIFAGLMALTGILFRKQKRVLISLAVVFTIASGLVFGVNFVFNNMLKPHQQTRISVLLGQTNDPLGVEYNVNQSKIAVGSGGFFGKGFLKGTQTKFDFVPEQSTDFIFCTIGEEQGFMGSLLLLGLFVGLLLRILYLAERQRGDFARIYAYGVFSILFLHLTINIGMTIGLMPIIGIPLPFVSYGGSSLVGFTILLFILVKLDAERLRFLR